jgi:hypothetical protein
MALSVEFSELVENFQWLTEAALTAAKEVIKMGATTGTNQYHTGYVRYHVVGESMKKRISNGSWCLIKTNPIGSRNGKIVLVQHRDIQDPDHGGTYTVKTYYSEKIEEEGVLVNKRSVLKPETNAYGYSPIFVEDGGEELFVVDEFLW